MILSPEGKIALEQWKWLGEQYQFIDLISFIIMPDHVHGIIRIDANYYNGFVVGNGRDRSLQQNQPDHHDCKIKPLPELIGAYKTTVSKRIHLSGNGIFKWQKSYYEHIIRNNRALNIIKHYIETNPEHWM